MSELAKRVAAQKQALDAEKEFMIKIRGCRGAEDAQRLLKAHNCDSVPLKAVQHGATPVGWKKLIHKKTGGVKYIAPDGTRHNALPKATVQHTDMHRPAAHCLSDSV